MSVDVKQISERVSKESALLAQVRAEIGREADEVLVAQLAKRNRRDPREPVCCIHDQPQRVARNLLEMCNRIVIKRCQFI